MLTKAFITKLILYYSAIYGIDGNVALSVAKTESSLNPNAIGKAKEVGIYQIKPMYSKYSKRELLDPVINIKEGIRMLQAAKKTCIHKKKTEWLICFNYGNTNAKKIKFPSQFPYVKKVNLAMKGNI